MADPYELADHYGVHSDERGLLAGALKRALDERDDALHECHRLRDERDRQSARVAEAHDAYLALLANLDDQHEEIERLRFALISLLEADDVDIHDVGPPGGRSQSVQLQETIARARAAAGLEPW